MPYAGWGGDYATSDEYETGTIVDYLTTTPAQFVVAFDPDLEWDDVRLSWSELLAERLYLESTLPAILLRRDKPKFCFTDLVIGNSSKAAWILPVTAETAQTGTTSRAEVGRPSRL